MAAPLLSSGAGERDPDPRTPAVAQNDHIESALLGNIDDRSGRMPRSDEETQGTPRLGRQLSRGVEPITEVPIGFHFLLFELADRGGKTGQVLFHRYRPPLGLLQASLTVRDGTRALGAG